MISLSIHTLSCTNGWDLINNVRDVCECHFSSLIYIYIHK